MPRSLAVAFRSHPLVFATVPPLSRASSARRAAAVSATAELVARAPRLDALNVPDLVDENHDGKPFYRTAEPRGYATDLAAATGREVIVNKVVAHLPSEEAVRSWAAETIRLGIRHAVLVGGSSRFIPYPGPPVAEANALVRPILDAAEGLLGNIAIPQRTGEAHRMLAKTRAGASFFTSQLVFDPGAITELLRTYDRLCRGAGVRPAAVLVSLGPVGDEADAAFVRWLGADLPDEVEQEILEPNGVDVGARSIETARRVWAAVRDTVEREKLTVPIGVNVEQLSARHLGHAERLLTAIAPTLDPLDAPPLADRPRAAPPSGT